MTAELRLARAQDGSTARWLSWGLSFWAHRWARACIIAWPLVWSPPAAADAGVSPARRSLVVEAVQRARQAVVSVRAERVVAAEHMGLDWFFRDFADPQRQRRDLSQGSGVIIDKSGLVLTNYHVIAAGGDIEIEIDDGRRLVAQVVGSTPDHDLAVLKVEAAGPLPALAMGRSHSLLIGETVIAIGNPFGLSHTVTTGVVSALHRTLLADKRHFVDFIQTDASINPGNSGGPLMTIDGELIGITTAIYERAQGIGFAIPIDKALRLVDDLMRFGHVRRPYFGFTPHDLSGGAARLSWAAGPGGVRGPGGPGDAGRSGDTGGALVTDIDPHGPAAGVLQEGDVIGRVEGARVDNAAALRLMLTDHTVGSAVLVELLRGGQRQKLVLTPREVDADEAMAQLVKSSGLTIDELSPAARRQLGLGADDGLLVITRVAHRSLAAARGIRPGDWLRAVDSEKVANLAACKKSLTRAWWRGQVTLLVQRGGAWQQFPFPY